jgi:hypothetical protein
MQALLEEILDVVVNYDNRKSQKRGRFVNRQTYKKQVLGAGWKSTGLSNGPAWELVYGLNFWFG